MQVGQLPAFLIVSSIASVAHPWQVRSSARAWYRRLPHTCIFKDLALSKAKITSSSVIRLDVRFNTTISDRISNDGLD